MGEYYFLIFSLSRRRLTHSEPSSRERQSRRMQIDRANDRPGPFSNFSEQRKAPLAMTYGSVRLFHSISSPFLSLLNSTVMTSITPNFLFYNENALSVPYSPTPTSRLLLNYPSS